MQHPSTPSPDGPHFHSRRHHARLHSRRQPDGGSCSRANRSGVACDARMTTASMEAKGPYTTQSGIGTSYTFNGLAQDVDCVFQAQETTSQCSSGWTVWAGQPAGPQSANNHLYACRHSRKQPLVENQRQREPARSGKWLPGRKSDELCPG